MTVRIGVYDRPTLTLIYKTDDIELGEKGTIPCPDDLPDGLIFVMVAPGHMYEAERNGNALRLIYHNTPKWGPAPQTPAQPTSAPLVVESSES